MSEYFDDHIFSFPKSVSFKSFVLHKPWHPNIEALRNMKAFANLKTRKPKKIANYWFIPETHLVPLSQTLLS